MNKLVNFALPSSLEVPKIVARLVVRVLEIPYAFAIGICVEIGFLFLYSLSGFFPVGITSGMCAANYVFNIAMSYFVDRGANAACFDAEI